MIKVIWKWLCFGNGEGAFVAEQSVGGVAGNVELVGRLMADKIYFPVHV